MQFNDCSICSFIAKLRTEGDSRFVYEFDKSWLVLGSHQYFRGYCLLLYKQHVRELHELDRPDYLQLSQELYLASQAIAKAFQPWKLNHACLGNQDQHIHWHIIPRYETDPDHTQHPWLHSSEFTNHLVSADEQIQLAAQIRSYITR